MICYGEDEACALFGLTNVIAVFGGGKDGLFNRELSELVGTSRVSRTTYSRGRNSAGTSHAGADEPILRPEEIRLLPERHALVIADNAKPLIAALTRCLDGKPGRALLAAQAAVKARVAAARARQVPVFSRATAAFATAQRLDLTAAAGTPAGGLCRRSNDGGGGPRGGAGGRWAVMVTRAFPEAGRLVEAAYRALHQAENGTPDQRRAATLLGTPERPWDPPSCSPAVREQVWQWLDAVAGWVNHEYAWGVERLVPACWPAHPHIAHELAVLADLAPQRGDGDVQPPPGGLAPRQPADVPRAGPRAPGGRLRRRPPGMDGRRPLPRLPQRREHAATRGLVRARPANRPAAGGHGR